VLQARAIIEAAVNVSKEGVKVHPHIMIPLVGIDDELVGQAKIVREVAEQVRQSCLFQC
jgi:pyruvate,orthophosphate dikinase